MIFKYVELLEEIINKESERSLRNMRALETIKHSLKKIDYKAEELILTSEEKFIDLLSSLKEGPLTADETEIAKQIIKIKKVMS